MPDDGIARISLTPGPRESPLASTWNGPRPAACAAMKPGNWPEATSMLPCSMSGMTSLVLAMVFIVTCRPCAAKMPRSWAMYRAAALSAGTAPTTTLGRSSLTVVMGRAGALQAANSTMGAAPRTTFATTRSMPANTVVEDGTISGVRAA
jgi:hypothetical protein